jgi:hypothetical protein
MVVSPDLFKHTSPRFRGIELWLIERRKECPSRSHQTIFSVLGRNSVVVLLRQEPDEDEEDEEEDDRKDEDDDDESTDDGYSE